VLIMLALCIALAATPATPQEILSRVQKAYAGASDFSAEFRQTLIRASRPGKGRSESGTVFLKRPGLMRWDYDQPAVKYFVIDGERLWFYKPDEAQVTVHDKFREADISAGLSFLWSDKKLANDFEVRHDTDPDPQGQPTPRNAIKLLPKKHEETIKELIFYVGDAGFIDKAIIADHLGNLNIIEFRKIKTNQGLKKDAFLFVPPDGVKVVHVE
jgi:outer membrane lipoprotein carrier protein